jgi:large-conductance mechanosensitive channel
MDILLQVLIGIGLSATCGFRVFVPLFVMSIAGVSGFMNFSPGFEWIAGYPALIIFGVATVLEIVAYFVPYVDNILDMASLPISVVAGVIIVASVVTDVDPFLRWTMAIIAGGGVAASTSLLSNGVHALSTATTGGVANPAVSTVESGASIVMTVLSIVLPIVGIVVVALVVFFVIRYIRRKKKRNSPQPTAPM